MTDSSNPPVTIIGGGIVGLCCALSLIERGKRVLLIDRGASEAPASHGNAGVISPWSCIPQSMPGVWKNVPKWLLDPAGPVSLRYRDIVDVLPWAWRFLQAGREDRVRKTVNAMATLNRHSIDLYRHHLSGTGFENLLRESWYLHVHRNASNINLDDLGWQLRQQQGAPVEVIDGKTLREIEPHLASDYQGAIVVKDQARALSPGRICEVLTEKVKALGAEIRYSTVHDIHRQENGHWLINIDGDTVESAVVVLAAGAWSADLLKPLGIAVPLQSERGYHLMFCDPQVSLTHSVMDADAMCVTSSMETGLRTAGTAEFASLDAPPNYRRAQILKHVTKRMLPALDTSQTDQWMGTRPSFPDSLPCIGHIPGQPGLLAAFGHSHYGMSMAPTTGQLVSQIASGSTPNIDLTPYHIGRFGTCGSDSSTAS